MNRDIYPPHRPVHWLEGLLRLMWMVPLVLIGACCQELYERDRQHHERHMRALERTVELKQQELELLRQQQRIR